MGKSEIEIEIEEANDIAYNVAEIISEVDEKLCDIVVISIDKMLEQLPQVKANCNTIYQVPKNLREINKKAYDPQFISIGPFHHGRKDLIANEHYKFQGFMNFLRRINNNKIESLEESHAKITTSLLNVLVKKSHCWVKEAWNCYAQPINMKEEKFVMTMLVDACFIVEFFILCYDQCTRFDKFFKIKDNVDISFYEGIFFEILIDLIKLENQVPFFLLQSLFDLIPKHDIPNHPVVKEDRHISFIELTFPAILGVGFLRKYNISDLYEEPKHLVDYMCLYFVPLTPVPDDMQINKQHEIKNRENNNNNFLSFFRGLWNKKANDLKKNKLKMWNLSPPSITELCEAGVTIKVLENDNLCLMNISFKNGVLEIPTIIIDGTFEVMIRNLIAFEQFPARNEKWNTIQYLSFLNGLINTEQDVHLLVHVGVITNSIGGSDKEVADMFNNLCKFVTSSNNSSHFDDIIIALRAHCNGWWNKSKASLKHNYFNTPWAIISFIAATFLILLTLLQTIFSVISAFPS